jgi:hypothetical protein
VVAKFPTHFSALEPKGIRQTDMGKANGE